MIIDKTSFASPNYNSREGTPISGIVVHSTEGVWASDLSWLCNPQTSGKYPPVSCHYVVAPDGIIYQIVDDSDRAWHAGSGEYAGCDDWNTISLGIEISHVDGDAYTQAQLIAVTDLTAMLIHTYGIAPSHVICHRWLRPGEKFDPTNVSDSMFNTWVNAFYTGTDYEKAWGPYYPYVPDFAITTTWQKRYRELGMAMTDETSMADDRVVRSFESGSVVWSPSGVVDTWTI